jgi:hypothetical protein
MLTLNIARRRHILGFETEERRLLIQARMRRRIAHEAENILRAEKKLGSNLDFLRLG